MKTQESQIRPTDERAPLEVKTKKFWSDIIGEYIATALLVYVVTTVCDNTSNDYLEYSLVYGFGTTTLVHWSEGLLNPALTVAFTSTGKLTFTKGVIMIIVEILGGISGAGLTYALTPSTSRHTLGDTVLHPEMSTSQGLFVEFILTFILTISVYAARDSRRSSCKGYQKSLSYGLTVVLCSLVGSQNARCGINPARSFGPAVVRDISGMGKARYEWQHHWIYWIGPIGGSLMAGVIYDFLRCQSTQEYVCTYKHAPSSEDDTQGETNL